MRALVMAGSAVILAVLPLSAQQADESRESAAVPQVSVTGHGESKAVPDRALITVGVQSRAATAADAAAENARKQAAVLDTLRKLGFTPEQLTTAQYNVRPETRHDPEGNRPRVIGYVVSNTVRIDIRQLDRAGRVIDAALAKGANEVHGLSFYLSDPGPARRAAIADAVRRARADAEALAGAAGGSLGRVLELSTSPVGPAFYRGAAMMDARSTVESAQTQISAGEETVRATVQVRWTFVPR